VLKGQVRRANGGLYYRSSAEFGEAVATLRDGDAERRALGAQGLAYVEREYRWDTVMARVDALLERARAARR
jgi:glycosyltransferase involved in cell wall biosynthesis